MEGYVSALWLMVCSSKEMVILPVKVKQLPAFVCVRKNSNLSSKKKNSNLIREDKSEGIIFFKLLKRFDQHVVCNDLDHVHIYTLPRKFFLKMNISVMGYQSMKSCTQI